MIEKFDYNEQEAKVIQLSNDAYFYLLHGEPCLDDMNYEEAEDIKAEYPYGFKLSQSVEYVEDSDLIETTIIPICKNNNSPFTHYRLDGKHFKSEFYYNDDKTKAFYRTYIAYKKEFRTYGWCDVKINQLGKPYINPNNCIFPLWGKSWAKY